MNIKSIVFLFSIVLLSSCVAEKRFQEEVAKVQRTEEERARLKTENLDLNAANTELTAELEAIEKRFNGLKNDTNVMGTSLRRLTKNYDKLDDTYERLMNQMSKIRDDNAEDAVKLAQELEKVRTDLIEREDQVNALELAMNKKERDLNRLNDNMKSAQRELTSSQGELVASQSELMQRQQRVQELEQIMAQKDSAVTALKNKVTEALLGFTDKGLTVVQKNGKVYVSMEESLLFASGSWNVDVKGKEALKQLAGVLETQPDVNIMIEGHTDDVPYKGSGQIKDNWDLSVVRATSIVKILMGDSKINPTQLTAAGRSEFLPLNMEDSKEARAENRRTEIIIAPKLDELLEMLEQN
ncbi:MAG: chemotaxis protein MotB [Granulosicoccus sp.]|jgi:chemotaxis protein MotB